MCICALVHGTWWFQISLTTFTLLIRYNAHSHMPEHPHTCDMHICDHTQHTHTHTHTHTLLTNIHIHMHPYTPASFDMKIPVDGLFFIGMQLVAISSTGKVAVWQSVQKHWQLQDVEPICSYDMAGSFLLLGCTNGSIYYIGRHTH